MSNIDLKHKTGCTKLLSRIFSFLKRILKVSSGRLSIVDRVKQENLTYLEKPALLELAKVVLANEKSGIDGAVIEAGCALGGSAIVIANSKKIERPFYIYDVFGLIPPPSEKDDKKVHERYKEIKSGKSKGIGKDVYYGYRKNLYETVQNNFALFDLDVTQNNIIMVKGFFEDTMSIDFPVSFAHIDCDWYQSVMICLDRIWPNLVLGGTLVFDDYDCWSGCRNAVDQYFFAQDKNSYKFIKKSRLHIIKLKV